MCQVAARRRGAAASMTVPSTSREPLGPTECHDEPDFQSETIVSPKKYLFVTSPLVSASQTLSALAWMTVAVTCVSAIIPSSRDPESLDRGYRSWERRGIAQRP